MARILASLSAQVNEVVDDLAQNIETMSELDASFARAELARILNRLLDRSPASLDALLIGMPLWTDNSDAEAWYFLDMQEAATDHTACPDAEGEIWSALG